MTDIWMLPKIMKTVFLVKATSIQVISSLIFLGNVCKHPFSLNWTQLQFNFEKHLVVKAEINNNSGCLYNEVTRVCLRLSEVVWGCIEEHCCWEVSHIEENLTWISSIQNSTVWLKSMSIKGIFWQRTANFEDRMCEEHISNASVSFIPLAVGHVSSYKYKHSVDTNLHKFKWQRLHISWCRYLQS